MPESLITHSESNHLLPERRLPVPVPACRAVAAGSAKTARQLQVDVVLIFADGCRLAPDRSLLVLEPQRFRKHPLGAGNQ